MGTLDSLTVMQITNAVLSKKTHIHKAAAMSRTNHPGDSHVGFYPHMSRMVIQDYSIVASRLFQTDPRQTDRLIDQNEEVEELVCGLLPLRWKASQPFSLPFLAEQCFSLETWNPWPFTRFMLQ